MLKHFGETIHGWKIMEKSLTLQFQSVNHELDQFWTLFKNISQFCLYINERYNLAIGTTYKLNFPSMKKSK